MRRQIRLAHRKSGPREHREARRLPELAPVLPRLLNGGFSPRSASDEICADDVPDLSAGLEACLQIAIAHELVVLKVEEIHDDTAHAAKGDVRQRSSENGRDRVCALFVRTGATGDDPNLIKAERQFFRKLEVMDSGRVETASKNGDALRHGCNGAGIVPKGQTNSSIRRS